MARIPWFEQAWGQDELARTHRLVGFTSFNLLWAHIVLITLGYAAGEPEGPLGHHRRLRRSTTRACCSPSPAPSRCAWSSSPRYEGRAATAALRVVAPHPPLRLPRRRPGPAAPAVDRHRLPRLDRPRPSSGGACMPCAPVPCSSSGSGCPLALGCGAPLRVLEVRAEGPGVTTVTVGGRGVRRARRCAAGQFFQWRFLDGPGWSRGQPLLALRGARRPHPAVHRRPRRRRQSARLATLRPGTRVLVEGPYGRLHAGVRTRRKVLLMGAGIGITPMRALLEDLDQAPGDVVVVHRVDRGDELVLDREIVALARLAAPATSSSRARGCPGRDPGCPARPPTSPTRRRCASSCPTSPSATSTSAGRRLDGCRAGGRRASPACPVAHIHLERFDLLGASDRATHHPLGPARTAHRPRAAVQLPHVDELEPRPRPRRVGHRRRHGLDVAGRPADRLGSATAAADSSAAAPRRRQRLVVVAAKTYTGDAVSTRFGTSRSRSPSRTARSPTPGHPGPVERPRATRRSTPTPCRSSTRRPSTPQSARIDMVSGATYTSDGLHRSRCSRPSTRPTCDHARSPVRRSAPRRRPRPRPPGLRRAGHGDAGQRPRARRGAGRGRRRGGGGARACAHLRKVDAVLSTWRADSDLIRACRRSSSRDDGAPVARRGHRPCGRGRARTGGLFTAWLGGRDGPAASTRPGWSRAGRSTGPLRTSTSCPGSRTASTLVATSGRRGRGPSARRRPPGASASRTRADPGAVAAVVDGEQRRGGDLRVRRPAGRTSWTREPALRWTRGRVGHGRRARSLLWADVWATAAWSSTPRPVRSGQLTGTDGQPQLTRLRSSGSDRTSGQVVEHAGALQTGSATARSGTRCHGSGLAARTAVLQSLDPPAGRSDAAEVDPTRLRRAPRRPTRLRERPSRHPARWRSSRSRGSRRPGDRIGPPDRDRDERCTGSRASATAPRISSPTCRRSRSRPREADGPRPHEHPAAARAAARPAARSTGSPASVVGELRDGPTASLALQDSGRRWLRWPPARTTKRGEPR